MEITLAYQGKTITLTAPERTYQSNLDAFEELLKLALTGVGLSLDGGVLEIPQTQPPEMGFTTNK